MTVRRSGDVIPVIHEVLEKAEPTFPSESFIWDSKRVDILLEDPSTNIDVIIKTLVQQFKILGTDGLREGIVERLVHSGYDSFKKIIALTVEDLVKIDGFHNLLMPEFESVLVVMASKIQRWWRVRTGKAKKAKLIEDYREKFMSTLLHTACFQGDSVDAIDKALESEFNVNETNKYDMTPLHVAVFMNHLEVAKNLILRGADIFAVDTSGHTTLHLACSLGHKKMFSELIGSKSGIVSPKKRLRRSALANE